MTIRPLLMCLLSIPGMLSAGDWMLSEGEQGLYAGLSLSRADSYWDDQRVLQEEGCNSRHWSLQLHYEYGYSYYRTLFVSTSFEKDRCGDESSTGIPDLKLGLRGRVNPFRNGYTWELAMILPINGDTRDRRAPGSGLFGLEAGLYRTYRDDPYVKPFTVLTRGIWGWGLSTTIWSGGGGAELQGELNWRKRLNRLWRFKAWLSGHYALTGTHAGDHFSSRKSSDYDELSLGSRLSRHLARNTRVGFVLEQALWGRSTSRDTTLRLEFSRSWD